MQYVNNPLFKGNDRPVTTPSSNSLPSSSLAGSGSGAASSAASRVVTLSSNAITHSTTTTVAAPAPASAAVMAIPNSNLSEVLRGALGTANSRAVGQVLLSRFKLPLSSMPEGGPKALWRGVLSRYCRYEGGSECTLDTELANVHTLLASPKLSLASRVSFTELMVQAMSLLPSLDRATFVPRGKRAPPPRPGSSSSVADLRGSGKRGRDDSSDSGSERATKRSRRSSPSPSRSPSPASRRPPSSPASSRASPRPRPTTTAGKLADAVRASTQFAGELQLVMRKATTALRIRDSGVQMLRDQAARLARAQESCQGAQRVSAAKATSLRDTLQQLDKNLQQLLPSGNTSVTAVLDLLATPTPDMQTKLQQRQLMIKEINKHEAAVESAAADVQLHAAVVKCFGALVTAVQRQLAMVLQRQREDRRSMMETATKSLSTILFVAQECTSFELTKQARAKEELGKLTKALEEHESLFGEVAPTRRAGLQQQAAEMASVLRHSQRTLAQLVLQLRNFARTTLPKFPNDVKQPVHDYLKSLLPGAKEEDMTAKEAREFKMLLPALQELQAFSAPDSKPAPPLPPVAPGPPTPTRTHLGRPPKPAAASSPTATGRVQHPPAPPKAASGAGTGAGPPAIGLTAPRPPAARSVPSSGNSAVVSASVSRSMSTSSAMATPPRPQVAAAGTVITPDQAHEDARAWAELRRRMQLQRQLEADARYAAAEERVRKAREEEGGVCSIM